MTPDAYSLAIETSSRHGSVGLGRGDQLVKVADLGAQRRHAVALLPAIDRLCQRHGVRPTDLAEIYLSVGPGSFTGLRVGSTAAKMLGWSLGCRLVGVPTLQVVAANAPDDAECVAVCLNAKRGQCFTGVFDRRDGQPVLRIGPALMRPDELVGQVDGELWVIGDHLPEYDWPERVTLLGEVRARPRCGEVWRIGRAMARAGQFTDPLRLAPTYVRLPEAEEKWRENQAAGGSQRSRRHD